MSIIPPIAIQAEARINGFGPKTPKALAVFEKQADEVRKKFGLVDSGLANGTLVCPRANAVLIAAFPQAIDEKKGYSPQEVIHCVKNAAWSRAKNQPAWAIESAKAFVRGCVATVAGIKIYH